MNFVIDTNAYSDFIRGQKNVLSNLTKASVVFVPVTVIAELKVGFYYGNKVSANLAGLEEFLAKPSVRILDITADTAEQYAHLRVFLKKQGTPIPINDVWIAALCVQYNLPLLTRDRDFERLPQVTLVST